MKKFRLLSLALAIVLCFSLVAGCSNNEATTPTPDAGGEEAGGGEEILIGLIANTSGSDAQYGLAVRNGVMLYVDQLNADGGINGKQVRVIEYDDKGEQTEASSAFNRLVDDGVTAVIASVLTAPTITVADLAYEINMPQITASATAAGVTVLDPDDPDSEIRTNVFRSCFIDPFQGEKMAEYAYEKLGATTAAVIFETGSDYSEGLKDAFVAKCAELGIEVVSEQAYSAGDVDFRAQMTTIASANPDVIFSPNYYEDNGMIVTQAREVGVEGTFLGGDGWGGVAGYASAEDLEGSVYCSGYAAGTEGVADFEAAYEAAYSEAVPSMFAPLAYDAAMLMCSAIQEAEDAGLTAGSDDYKQAVIDALKATSGLEGVTGTYSFDEQNNPIKDAAIMQLQGGAEVFTEMF